MDNALQDPTNPVRRSAENFQAKPKQSVCKLADNQGKSLIVFSHLPKLAPECMIEFIDFGDVPLPQSARAAETQVGGYELTDWYLSREGCDRNDGMIPFNALDNATRLAFGEALDDDCKLQVTYAELIGESGPR